MQPKLDKFAVAYSIQQLGVLVNPRDISYLSQGNKKSIVPSSPLSSVWLEAMYGEDLR